eukprot:gnl/Hemi2/17778_TR5863_c0_g2_i1.p1 gnl/Hemi2/17778_TR5863_c0_g2~~gnl/Hemi2/17778_TR5863_c0_g2_i1.p1  ORF type:complete len:226 (+),score=63.89 gnl/Hemi2/17778_TR5863_c0_g2_i1:62-739(+)
MSSLASSASDLLDWVEVDQFSLSREGSHGSQGSTVSSSSSSPAKSGPQQKISSTAEQIISSLPSSTGSSLPSSPTPLQQPLPCESDGADSGGAGLVAAPHATDSVLLLEAEIQRLQRQLSVAHSQVASLQGRLVAAEQRALLAEFEAVELRGALAALFQRADRRDLLPSYALSCAEQAQINKKSGIGAPSVGRRYLTSPVSRMLSPKEAFRHANHRSAYCARRNF